MGENNNSNHHIRITIATAIAAANYCRPSLNHNYPQTQSPGAVSDYAEGPGAGNAGTKQQNSMAG